MMVITSQPARGWPAASPDDPTPVLFLSRMSSLRPISSACALAVAWSLAATTAGVSVAEPRSAIAMQGEPALAPGFTSFPYVNPQAPKGGALVQGALGTFDS